MMSSSRSVSVRSTMRVALKPRITDRVQAEQARRRSRSKFSSSGSRMSPQATGSPLSGSDHDE